MKLIEVLNRDRLTAFKARDKVKSTLLATLIAEVRADVRKEANREARDDEVLAKVRKFIKNNEETLRSAGGEAAARLEEENRIIGVYLPQSLDGGQLESLIRPLVAALPERSPRAMGQVMGQLKGRADVDMKRASAIVRRLLSG